MGFVVAWVSRCRLCSGKYPWHELDPFIYTSGAGLRDFPNFVHRLESICRPNTQIFETFSDTLKKVHRELNRFWTVLADPEPTKKDRRELSKQIIDELDNTVGYGKFLDELSACIQVEDILKKTDAAAQNS